MSQSKVCWGQHIITESVPMIAVPKSDFNTQFGNATLFTIREDALLEHIMRAHLEDLPMRQYGVPRFDLEICQYRGFSVAPAVKKIYSIMSKRPDILEEQMGEYKYDTCAYDQDKLSPVMGFRLLLGQTLTLIEHMKLHSIEWNHARIDEPSSYAFDVSTSSQKSFFQSDEYLKHIGAQR